MKFLFVTSKPYIPQTAGGSVFLAHDLCCEIQLKGEDDCAVLASLTARKDKTWAINRIKSKITNQSHPFDNSLNYRVYRGWDAAEGISEVVKNYQPDVAIILAGAPVTLSNEFIRHGIKTVVYLMDVEFDVHGGDYKPDPLLYFLSNSQFTADTFYEQFKIKSDVVQPLVRTDNYITEGKGEKVVFICPDPVKGVELAFKLAEANNNISFLFVESWPIPKEVKPNFLKRAEKSGNIEWLEKQSNMKKVYQQAKILLVPSICCETWGRVVTESQASGIPTLASNRGGLPESVGFGGVVLEPENNFLEWNEQLLNLYFDNAIYEEYSKKAIEHAQREQIQPKRLLNKLISFIRAV